MDRETKTRTSLGVCLGEGDTLGDKSTAASDSQLVASNVMLSTTGCACGVESDSLSSEEVVARSDVGWDLEVEFSAYIMLVMH